LSKPTNIPEKEAIRQGVRVAVGNTSVDALTALILNQVKNAGREDQVQADYLEAFQYNLLSTLDQVGSQTLLDQQIRRNWFGSEPGGIRWTIVAQERADHQAGQKPPKISSDQAAGLAELNRKQRALDAERRILDSMQWELYALWWKRNRIEYVDPRRYSQPGSGGGKAQTPRPEGGTPAITPPAEGDQAAKPDSLLGQILQSLLQLIASWFGKREQGPQPEEERDENENDPTHLPQLLARQLDLGDPHSFASQVKVQQEKVEGLAQAVPLAWGPGSESSLAAYALRQLELDPEELALKASRMPRFWYPNDPVVLISGLGRPPMQGQEGALLCRLASQIINEITVPTQGKSIRLSAGALINLIPRLSNEGLPAGVPQLLEEAFFLDPGNAEILAQAGLPSGVTRQAVEKAILDLQPAPPQGTSVIGRYGALAWEQPWSPLFLDWQVSFYYTFEVQDNSFKTDRDGNYIFARESWEFDGTDASWTGPKPSPQHQRSYSGRTFLTPHAPLTFVDRLRKVLQSQPNNDLEANEAFWEKITNWDILSQTLSGFTDQLALRDLEYTVPPSGPLTDLIGDHHQGVPFMTIVPDPGTGTPFFFPLRAGFLKFEALRIVDKYGRTLNLLSANNNPSGSEKDFLPIRGRGMIPSQDRDRRLAILPPRVVQSSRLSFRFVSAIDDRLEIDLAPDANPVCGWLLPNHINKSISVYQAEGNLLGELLLIRKSKDESIVHWQPAPGAPNQSPAGYAQDDIGIANRHLKNMIEALIRRKDQGVAFGNLQQVIDETLWTIDPLGQRDDQNLSVLIGRPLALVRANLQLELRGKPCYNQAWLETFVEGSSRFKENHGGLLSLEFPIRLGSQELRNDGLIGYFQGTTDHETDYTHFHAVHRPTSLQPDNSAYINHIGANQDYVRLKFKATSTIPFDPAGSVYLTMLIDPRGVIHTNCGLLPTKIVELPARYVREALDRMAVTFRAGPLLLEPETVRLPLAAEQRGTWTWIQATGTKEGEWLKAPIVKADAKARLSTSPLNLVEGWLKFTPDEIDE
jgi:hypothetical protein